MGAPTFLQPDDLGAKVRFYTLAFAPTNKNEAKMDLSTNVLVLQRSNPPMPPSSNTNI